MNDIREQINLPPYSEEKWNSTIKLKSIMADKVDIVLSLNLVFAHHHYIVYKLSMLNLFIGVKIHSCEPIVILVRQWQYR